MMGATICSEQLGNGITHSFVPSPNSAIQKCVALASMCSEHADPAGPTNKLCVTHQDAALGDKGRSECEQSAESGCKKRADSRVRIAFRE
jgi:hypothetical protein